MNDLGKVWWGEDNFGIEDHSHSWRVSSRPFGHDFYEVSLDLNDNKQRFVVRAVETIKTRDISENALKDALIQATQKGPALDVSD